MAAPARQVRDPAAQINFEALFSRIYFSDGNPNGTVRAPLGSLCLNRQGGANLTLWVKETAPTDSTGWVAK